MTMLVLIPSYDRAETITTHEVFAGWDCKVLVHDETQAQAYRRRVTGCEVVVTGVESGPGGKTRQMEWGLNEFAQMDQWVVIADDNIRGLTAVPEPEYSQARLPAQNGEGERWRDLFNSPCDLARFERIVADCIGVADGLGANLCGFATNGNPYFRGRKWRAVGFVHGKLTLWRHCRYRFDDQVGVLDDFLNTAEHLVRFGAVAINNYLRPLARNYQPGGHGVLETREPLKAQDADYLIGKYPGLFRIHDKPGFAPGTELAVRFNSLAQVRRWRKQMFKRRLFGL